MNAKDLLQLLCALKGLKFFPKGAIPLRGLAAICAAMTDDIERIRWVVKRLLTLYDEWPGPREFRAVYCSRWRPLDGQEAWSSHFPDGLPSEKPPAPPNLLPPGVNPGDKPTVDPAQIDRTMQTLARAKDMNRSLKLSRPRELPPNRNFTPITQADIDRELEKRMAERVEKELRNKEAS